MACAEECVREPPRALPDRPARKIRGVCQTVGAVPAEGRENPAVVGHVDVALVSTQVNGVQRGIARSLHREGERVDLG